MKNSLLACGFLFKEPIGNRFVFNAVENGCGPIKKKNGGETGTPVEKDELNYSPGVQDAAAVQAANYGAKKLNALEAINAKKEDFAQTDKHIFKEPIVVRPSKEANEQNDERPKLTDEKRTALTREYINGKKGPNGETLKGKVTSGGFQELTQVALTDPPEKVAEAVRKLQKSAGLTGSHVDGIFFTETYDALTKNDPIRASVLAGKLQIRSATALGIAAPPTAPDSQPKEKVEKIATAPKAPELPSITFPPTPFEKLPDLEDLAAFREVREKDGGFAKGNIVFVVSATGGENGVTHVVDAGGEENPIPTRKLATVEQDDPGIMIYTARRFDQVQGEYTRITWKDVKMLDGNPVLLDTSKTTNTGVRTVTDALGNITEVDAARLKDATEAQQAYYVVRRHQHEQAQYTQKYEDGRKEAYLTSHSKEFADAKMDGVVKSGASIVAIDEKTGIRYPFDNEKEKPFPVDTSVAVLGKAGNQYKVVTSDGRMMGFVDAKDIKGDLKVRPAEEKAAAAAVKEIRDALTKSDAPLKEIFLGPGNLASNAKEFWQSQLKLSDHDSAIFASFSSKLSDPNLSRQHSEFLKANPNPNDAQLEAHITTLFALKDGEYKTINDIGKAITAFNAENKDKAA